MPSTTETMSRLRWISVLAIAVAIGGAIGSLVVFVSAALGQVTTAPYLGQALGTLVAFFVLLMADPS